MLYISYIINIFHTLYIIWISYMFFCFLQKYSLSFSHAVLYNIIFHCKFPLGFFSTCIITYFFDILRLLILISPPSTIILSCTLIRFSRVTLKH